MAASSAGPIGARSQKRNTKTGASGWYGARPTPRGGIPVARAWGWYRAHPTRRETHPAFFVPCYLRSPSLRALTGNATARIASTPRTRLKHPARRFQGRRQVGQGTDVPAVGFAFEMASIIAPDDPALGRFPRHRPQTFEPINVRRQRFRRGDQNEHLGAYAVGQAEARTRVGRVVDRDRFRRRRLGFIRITELRLAVGIQASK